MKEGFKGGPQSVSVSPFPLLGKFDSPSRKSVGSALRPEVGGESGPYEQFRMAPIT